jgi:serine/threonine protein kinase/pSer/pThr/pTyr-binding forkhead associated (FHA) protein
MQALEEGQRFERYRVLRRLGSSVSGISYEAEDTFSQRKVTLKLIHSWATLQDAARRQFFREMQGIGELTHPALAAVLDYGEVDGRLYIARRYVTPGSLLGSEGRYWFQPPLDISYAVHYTRQLAKALQHIHSNGFLHGSLTFANILVLHGSDADSNPFLIADVGTTHFVRRFGQPQSTLLPITAAPEQFGQRVTPASDQYALAVMLYFWLTGRLPFLGTPEEIEQLKLTETLSTPTALNLKVPLELEGVIRRALRVYPEERYPSILAFADALQAAIAHLMPTSPSTKAQNAVHPDETMLELATPVEDVTTSEETEKMPSILELLSRGALPPEPVLQVDQPLQPTQPMPSELPSQPAMPEQPTQPTSPELPILPTQPEQPAQPETPALPAYPEIPSQPAAPEQPAQPAQPDLPSQPVAPEQPTQPVQPETPTEPAQPEQPSQPAPLPQIVPDVPQPLPEPTPTPDPLPEAPQQPAPEPDIVLPPAPDIPQPIPESQPIPPIEPAQNSALPLREKTDQDGTESTGEEAMGPLQASFVITSPYSESPQEVVVEREETTLGRAGSSDILLDLDTLTSRHHALLKRDGDRYFIYDRRSANGVMVNGEKIVSETAYEIKDGDYIIIGEYELIFHLNPLSQSTQSGQAMYQAL